MPRPKAMALMVRFQLGGGREMVPEVGRVSLALGI